MKTAYLRHNVKRIQQHFQNLSSSGRLRSLLQTVRQSHERPLHASSKRFDLLSELQQRGPHAHHGGVDIDKLGAEIDEISVVTVDKVDEFVVEGGKVGLELRPERVEGDESSELRNVGISVEGWGEEEVRFEPKRVGVQWVREEVRGGSRRWRIRDRIRGHLDLEGQSV